ncbi:hypothetical protein [Staphylococcus aureus]|uniref:hypothetical protein n=1 Tax=Staphylococcus aureus TaxID=1280 RepID=UPI000910F29D|nr:hypothetical protein [Staphylococcus aureus]WJA73294.1 hypothetical protein PCL37_00140 [Staphylococcus aureus]SGS45233.1 type I restriction modification DNA specificity domain protein [Staphylococcus aureus]
MKQGVVSSKKLFRRLDVKYHFNENKEIDNYDKLCDFESSTLNWTNSMRIDIVNLRK